MAASLKITGLCSICQAQQINHSIVVPGAGAPCDDLEHVWQPVGKDLNDREKPSPNANAWTMPYREEAEIYDRLEKHEGDVDKEIIRTEQTIDRMRSRHERWRDTIHTDFEAIMEAAEAARTRLIRDLDSLNDEKLLQLHEQLEQYTTHCEQTKQMMATIKYRIDNDDRNDERKDLNVRDGRATISQFPQLTPVKIAVAVECQVQAIVDTLMNFGGVLESNLGRLPIVEVKSANAKTGAVSFVVQEPEDVQSDDVSDEKVSLDNLDLQVQVQASAFSSQSLGWEIITQNQEPYARGKRSITLPDIRKLGGKTVVVRARTLILPKNEKDPIRISAWSNPLELESGPAPPQQPMMVKLVGEVGGRPNVVRLNEDYETELKNAAKTRYGWECELHDIRFQILHKSTNEVIHDGEDITTALLSVFNRREHIVLAIQGGEGPVLSKPDGQKSPKLVRSDVSFPDRLAVKCRASEQDGAKTCAVMLRNRAHEGDWMQLVQQRCGEKFENVDAGGNLEMFFVSGSGERVQDVNCDADLLFATQNRDARVVCRNV